MTDATRMKELKEYIHLYIGCPLQILCDMPDGKYFLSGSITKQIPGTPVNRVQVWNEQRQQIYWLDVDVITLILRPLDSMTPNDACTIVDSIPGMVVQDCYSFIQRWVNDQSSMLRFKNIVEWVNQMRKMGFDVDGLKKAGLAVYETDKP